MTQSAIVKKLLEEKNDWMYSYEFVCKSTKYGWLGTQGDRRAFELAKKGEIEHRIIKKYAEFRAYTPLGRTETPKVDTDTHLRISKPSTPPRQLSIRI